MGKGQFLGEFEQMVLLAIVRLEDNAYGVTIRQIIEGRTDRTVAIGAVYAALERLEAKRYLKSTASGPEPIRGGRSKRLYHITAAGARALSHSQAMMAKMAEGLVLDDRATS
jgi:DNA-binding PadR family transcriptional regulator